MLVTRGMLLRWLGLKLKKYLIYVEDDKNRNHIRETVPLEMS